MVRCKKRIFTADRRCTVGGKAKEQVTRTLSRQFLAFDMGKIDSIAVAVIQNMNLKRYLDNLSEYPKVNNLLEIVKNIPNIEIKFS